ncbi:MAG: NAD(P)/FAD-dependent oxidoreductase, partial [Chthoniobacteraceae bacterium]
MDFSYDAVIIGGAFSGAATALLLRRRAPQARILIIEKSAAFDRKVGESTTEVSSCFLTKTLGLSTYLGHHQLPKQGLRMWFARSSGDAFDAGSEIGAKYNSRLSGYQVDRSTLDEHLQTEAVATGCELWRPAKVTKLELSEGGENLIEVFCGGESRRVRARWVIDASGKVAMITRHLDHWRRNDAHPISSMWARFTGVKDWDGHELRDKFPCWANSVATGRNWATNHLMGDGWWCWIIPLKGGDTSVGLVYDKRLFEPPSGGTIAERLHAHCLTHPVGKEILERAEAVPGDQRAYSSLAYYSEKIAGDGWFSVGDAASFIDPLYSSGLDFCAFTSQGAAALVARSLAGEDIAHDLASYNKRFQFCHRAWFDSIYRDKYQYVGDAELMGAAFLMDIASYHLGPVRQVYGDPS